MNAQLQRLPEWLEYYAAFIRTFEDKVTPFKGNFLNIVRRIPLGIVAQITPWNHPMLIAIKKIAPALAAGFYFLFFFFMYFFEFVCFECDLWRCVCCVCVVCVVCVCVHCVLCVCVVRTTFKVSPKIL